MKPTYIQVLIKNNAWSIEANCLKVEGLIFILMYCMLRYSYKIFWMPWNFEKISKNAGNILKKKLAGKELKHSLNTEAKCIKGAIECIDTIF